MTPHYITIIGNVGVGKSTLAATLARALDIDLVPADELYLTNPFFKLAVADRKRWSLTSDLWFLMEREKMLQQIFACHAPPQSAPHKSQPKKTFSCVVDSGLAMSWVYAHSRIGSGFYTEQEWQLYQQLFEKVAKNVPQQSIFIHLTAPIEFLMENIRRRGRKFELTHFDAAYLQSLQSSLEQFTAQLPAERLINFSADLNGNQKNVVEMLDLLLNKK